MTLWTLFNMRQTLIGHIMVRRILWDFSVLEVQAVRVALEAAEAVAVRSILPASALTAETARLRLYVIRPVLRIKMILHTTAILAALAQDLIVRTGFSIPPVFLLEAECRRKMRHGRQNCSGRRK